MPSCGWQHFLTCTFLLRKLFNKGKKCIETKSKEKGLSNLAVSLLVTQKNPSTEQVKCKCACDEMKFTLRWPTPHTKVPTQLLRLHEDSTTKKWSTYLPETPMDPSTYNPLKRLVHSMIMYIRTHDYNIPAESHPDRQFSSRSKRRK